MLVVWCLWIFLVKCGRDCALVQLQLRTSPVTDIPSYCHPLDGLCNQRFCSCIAIQRSVCLWLACAPTPGRGRGAASGPQKAANSFNLIIRKLFCGRGCIARPRGSAPGRPSCEASRALGTHGAAQLATTAAFPRSNLRRTLFSSVLDWRHGGHTDGARPRGLVSLARPFGRAGAALRRAGSLVVSSSSGRPAWGGGA